MHLCTVSNDTRSTEDPVNAREAHAMLNYHQRFARIARREAADPNNRKHADDLLRKAHAADMRAAECQGICQIARMAEGA